MEIWRDSALALAEKAIEIDPALPDGYILRGRIKYNEFGMIDEYRTDLEEAYRLAPGDAGVQSNLGILYLNDGRYQEGVKGIRSLDDRDLLLRFGSCECISGQPGGCIPLAR